MKQLNDIIDYLKIIIEDVSLGKINRHTIQNDSIILDLGIDSLDFASIMLSGETFINNKVNENNIDWKNIQTVYQLAHVLYECQK
jgi:acyl carrier protein